MFQLKTYFCTPANLVPLTKLLLEFTCFNYTISIVRHLFPIQNYFCTPPGLRNKFLSYLTIPVLVAKFLMYFISSRHKITLGLLLIQLHNYYCTSLVPTTKLLLNSNSFNYKIIFVPAPTRKLRVAYSTCKIIFRSVSSTK